MGSNVFSINPQIPQKVLNFFSIFLADTIDRLKSQSEKFGWGQIRVLDLACGKGGDLRKWRVGGIDEIVMTGLILNIFLNSNCF